MGDGKQNMFSPRQSGDLELNKEELKIAEDMQERHAKGEHSLPGESAAPWDEVDEFGTVTKETSKQV